MRVEFDLATGVIVASDSGGTLPEGCVREQLAIAGRGVVMLDVADVDPAKQRIDPSTLQIVTREHSYRARRRLTYPALTDLADALYWQARGQNAPMQAWLAACDAVKTNHPRD